MPDACVAREVGVVVIGRNEGDRLRRCLRSLIEQAELIVYVDSGSSDESVPFARSLGVSVVELDLSLPFTMARGRNTGYRRLRELVLDIEYVQFIDGDCEMVKGWIERGRQVLRDQAEVAAVCGRRRERDRAASVYNRLIDMEWDGPLGEVANCGGDVMFRVAALDQTGGFNEGMIAGEEPELCCRLRNAGWKILRLEVEMTLHDAAMTRFSEWWKRAIRGGHAYAEGAALHGRTAARHNVRQIFSAMFWGFGAIAGLCMSIAAALLWTRWAWVSAAVLLCAYFALGWRIRRSRRSDSRADAWLYAVFCMLGKTPQVLGILQYAWNRIRGRRSNLIEYKRAAERSPTSSVSEGQAV